MALATTTSDNKERTHMKSARNAGIDHLRILLTLLVVLHHCAITYGGAGSWYWREEENASQLLLVAFNALNQSFFMGFFFLLAGYFSSQSLATKTPGVFLQERLLRLGLPLLASLVILSPLTVALTQADSPADIWPVMRWRINHWQMEPGPLWFNEALLLFSLCFLVVRQRLPQAKQLPSVRHLSVVAALLALVAFALRLWLPVGQSIAWLQLGYFPCYVFLFFAGCVSHRHRVLETLRGRQVLPWASIALTGIVGMPALLSGQFGSGAFEGGLNANALIYAFWDPFTGFGIGLSLLWIAHQWWSGSTTMSRFLARRSYGIFILHAPILVGCSLLAQPLTLPPLAKCLVVGLAAFTVAAALTSLLLCIRPLRRIL